MSHQPHKPILLINSALQEASIGIADDGKLIDQIVNTYQKEHAAFLHPAIETLCKKNNLPLNKLNAVSVINGPGSYTGLRVGLSAAKGICYANQIPLICINTLEWIAFGNKEQAIDLIAPMIDARRMEVFTAVYSKQLQTILPPTNLILEEQSYMSYLSNNKVLFVGDGAIKWKGLTNHPNAHFTNACHDEKHHAAMASNNLNTQTFSSVFSAAPYYTKDFYSTQKS